MKLQASAKINLCLYLGPQREDGLHELCSLFEPLILADLLTVSEAERDEVVCPGVEGENLAARALAALREAGWKAPPLRIEIEKRIPVAAGLGGGSADAAAVLRLARAAFNVPENGNTAQTPDLAKIAMELGADVPSQLEPALSLVTGAGERVEPLPEPARHAALLLSSDNGLSTADVFAEADRLGLGRSSRELEEIGVRLREAAGAGASPLSYSDLFVNDLEPAARSLRTEIGEALETLRGLGASIVFMSGSGPTAVGLFEEMTEASAALERIDRDGTIACLAGVAA